MVSIEGLKRLPQSTGQFHFALLEARPSGPKRGRGGWKRGSHVCLALEGIALLRPPGLSEAALLDDITKCWKEKWRGLPQEEGGGRRLRSTGQSTLQLFPVGEASFLLLPQEVASAWFAHFFSFEAWPQLSRSGSYLPVMTRAIFLALNLGWNLHRFISVITASHTVLCYGSITKTYQNPWSAHRVDSFGDAGPMRLHVWSQLWKRASCTSCSFDFSPGTHMAIACAHSRVVPDSISHWWRECKAWTCLNSHVALLESRVERLLRATCVTESMRVNPGITRIEIESTPTAFGKRRKHFLTIFCTV